MEYQGICYSQDDLISTDQNPYRNVHLLIKSYFKERLQTSWICQRCFSFKSACLVDHGEDLCISQRRKSKMFRSTHAHFYDEYRNCFVRDEEHIKPTEGLIMKQLRLESNQLLERQSCSTGKSRESLLEFLGVTPQRVLAASRKRKQRCSEYRLKLNQMKSLLTSKNNSNNSQLNAHSRLSVIIAETRKLKTEALLSDRCYQKLRSSLPNVMLNFNGTALTLDTSAALPSLRSMRKHDKVFTSLVFKFLFASAKMETDNVGCSARDPLKLIT